MKPNEFLDSLPLNRSTVNFLLALIAAAALISVSELGYRRADGASELLSTVMDRRHALNRLMQLALDAETGQRGYMITGQSSYLEPYNAAVANIGSTLDEIRAHYVGLPADLQIFAELSRSVSKKLAELEVTIAMRQRSPSGVEWQTAMDTAVGRLYMDNVRTLGATLIERTNVEASVMRGQIDQSLMIARVGVGLGALAALLAFYMYLRQSARFAVLEKEKAMALASERDQLDRLVSQRTEDLTILANQLQTIQESEREHLARELHDEMGALMTAAKLDVARLRAMLQPLTPAVAERIEHLVSSLNAGIALKRRITEDLRPSALSDLGLAPAVEFLVKDFAQRTEIDTTIQLDPIDVPQDVGLTIYRTVQESLTNISRYARATKVDVSLTDRGSTFELKIKDNGIGFDVDKRLNASRGLAGIRHRVQAARGRLVISAAPGAGCSISATFPGSTTKDSL